MRKTRVLIVDDERCFTCLVRMILEGQGGYEVMVVSRAKLALKAALQFQPNVMLLNVNMPDKESDDMARATAGNARLRNIPIIFLTPRVRSGGSTYPVAQKWRDARFGQSDRVRPAFSIGGRHCFNMSDRLKVVRAVSSSPALERGTKPLFDLLLSEKVAQAGEGGSGR